MTEKSRATVIKHRLLGLVFIALIGGLVTLSLAIYAKAFTRTVDVTLETDHTGNQLLKDSDVKIRGLIVGSVSDVSVDGSGAVVQLELMPEMVDKIPRNVSAQILPKTLFGEQYVSLIPPRVPAEAIAAGDVIRQDQSRGALEAQTVLDHLFPVLTAVRPADLNATLTAVATALSGRGEKLGQTLSNLDHYVSALNPHTRTLIDDFRRLGEVADEYNDAAPNILDALTNLQTTVRTVVDKRQAIDEVFAAGTDTAALLRSFLASNGQRLIAVTGQTAKIYPLLARYSPSFACFFAGLNKFGQGITKAFHDHTFHLSTIVDTTNLGGYEPGEEPRLVTGLGPNCFGLPDNVPVDRNGYFQIPDDPKYRCANDGAALTGDPCGRRPTTTAETRAVDSGAENALVNVLVAHDYGTTAGHVPAVATMLAAPLLRGQQVSVR